MGGKQTKKNIQTVLSVNQCDAKNNAFVIKNNTQTE